MSAKAIREYYGKQLIAKWLPEYSGGKHHPESRQVLITPDDLDSTKGKGFELIAQDHPWLLTEKLVVKPDQLIKRRGKAGLLAVNKTWDEVQKWIMDRMQREVQVEKVKGVLNHFLVEVLVPHKPEEEYYYCIQVRDSYPRAPPWPRTPHTCPRHTAMTGDLPGRAGAPRITGGRTRADACAAPAVESRGRGDPVHARGGRGHRRRGRQGPAHAGGAQGDPHGGGH
jgi:hypothetical protein